LNTIATSRSDKFVELTEWAEAEFRSVQRVLGTLLGALKISSERKFILADPVANCVNSWTHKLILDELFSSSMLGICRLTDKKANGKNRREKEGKSDQVSVYRLDYLLGDEEVKIFRARWSRFYAERAAEDCAFANYFEFDERLFAFRIAIEEVKRSETIKYIRDLRTKRLAHALDKELDFDEISLETTCDALRTIGHAILSARFITSFDPNQDPDFWFDFYTHRAAKYWGAVYAGLSHGT
jgi:hypothetical protein